MAKTFACLQDNHKEFIQVQHIFFVATALAEGSINLSPKGIDSFRIINANKVIWLNLIGSGNETCAHVLKNPRITIMFCAFEGNPLILKLYGKATILHKQDAAWNEYIELFDHFISARQIVIVDIEKVISSCGMGVPLFAYQGQREDLLQWADKKGEQALQEYWEQRNQVSIDGEGIYNK